MGRERFSIFWNILTFFSFSHQSCGKGEVINLLEYFDIFLLISIVGRERLSIFWNILTLFSFSHQSCGKGEVFNILEYFDIFLSSSVLWGGNGGRATAAPLAPSWEEGVASYRW